MTFDLISDLHMQIQTWHPPLRLCIHAKYYVKSGLTNVLKNANKPKICIFFQFGLPTKNQIWPRHKKDQGQPSFIICENLVPIATYQGLGILVPVKKIFKGVLPLIGMVAILVVR